MVSDNRLHTELSTPLLRSYAAAHGPIAGVIGSIDTILGGIDL